VHSINTSPFPGALTLKSTVDVNGNNVTADAYDSTDPTHSSWQVGLGYGTYVNTGTSVNPLRAADGNIATDGSIINIGNGNVYGHVDTGPGGNVAVGANGSVGGLAWVNTGTRGIQPGYSQDDMNVSFPDVVAPTNSWIPLANNANITNSGSYAMNQITGPITIDGGTNRINVTLYLTNGITLNGQDMLTITNNAYVTIYAGGSITETGNGAINNASQHPAQLIIYGLPTLTTISLVGNGAFWGAIYAPEADVTFKGAGSAGGYYGALTGNSIKLTGNSTFSYDMSLGHMGNTGFTVTSWQEIR
jgi:hypothetical protein